MIDTKSLPDGTMAHEYKYKCNIQVVLLYKTYMITHGTGTGQAHMLQLRYLSQISQISQALRYYYNYISKYICLYTHIYKCKSYIFRECLYECNTKFWAKNSIRMRVKRK